MTGTTTRELRRIRRSRRHPRPWQFDYLHLNRLVTDLGAVLSRLSEGSRVLDVYCGTRPYEDLLPNGATCVGLDIEDPFGMVDVISRRFLPFADASFDVVLCTEAFQYVDEPSDAVAEFARVLRPGGTAIVSVPLVWEYDRTGMEFRFTGPHLSRLFERWDGVRVMENGGFAVSWATLTGRIANLAQGRLERRAPNWAVRGLFSAVYGVINVIGLMLDAAERTMSPRRLALPMNLLVVATRPTDLA